MDVPVYVINLDRSPERLAFMQEQFRTLGLAFSRIPAVDGRLLSNQDVSAIRKAWAAARKHFAPPNAGEIGAYRSHLRAWQAIADGKHAFGVVLEDDVEISPDLHGRVSELARVLSSRDVVDLMGRRGAIRRRRLPIADGLACDTYVLPRLGMQGKLIGREAAATLVATLSRCEAPIDVLLQRRRNHGLTMWTVDPPLIRHADQRVGGSTLSTGDSRRLGNELRRPLWRAAAFFDNLLYG